VARVVADRIAVMYLGRIVELGSADEVVTRPRHPYTRALVSAVPDLGASPAAIPGEPASPLDPPPGCAFNPRCPIAIEACADPELIPRLARPAPLHSMAAQNNTTDRSVVNTEAAPADHPASPPHLVACIRSEVS
jgi:peptide/nickel transport system ATP-binding protein